MSGHHYALAFNSGLCGTFVCYVVFFVTGRIYVLGIACFLTFLTIFMPILIQRGRKAKEIVR